MIAFGLRPACLAVSTAPAMRFTSILKVFASTSTNTGVAPTRAATSAVAQNVNDGHSTASPGPTPMARTAECCEIAFERPNLRSQDKLAMVQNSDNRVIDGRAQAPALSCNINEW